MALCGLIVGLGNPGAEYASTRHNFGFMAVETLLREMERCGTVRQLSGQKDPYGLWRIGFGADEWLVMTPLTFMNRSGDPVQRVAAYYRLQPEQILVMHDELDLPLGRMKLKKGGGNAGHNGLKSLQQMLGTPDFYRLRLGIGRPKGYDGASYVLGRFSAEERDPLDKTLAAAVQGVTLFMREGERKAQQFCNGFSLEPEKAPEESAKKTDSAQAGGGRGPSGQSA